MVSLGSSSEVPSKNRFKPGKQIVSSRNIVLSIVLRVPQTADRDLRSPVLDLSVSWTWQSAEQLQKLSVPNALKSVHDEQAKTTAALNFAWKLLWLFLESRSSCIKVR